MTEPVTIAMPAQLTPEMIQAVRQHPLTSCDDIEQWHARLGWLICAWDVLIEVRQAGRASIKGEGGDV